jgi:1-phosphofructokinase
MDLAANFDSAVHRRPAVAVLAPAPLLTITIEAAGPREDVHLHPGGQGVWIARLIANLDIDVVLCATFGGETGEVTQGLLARWGLDLRAVPASGWNGTYIHDRRSGTRVPIAESPGASRSRHEVDELFGATLVAGLEAGLVVLGGPETTGLARGQVPDVIPADIYARLARDLRSNGVRVIADLSGTYLDAAASGGVDVVKVSDEDLLACGHVNNPSLDALEGAAADLTARGADAVIVTRAERPALVLADGTIWQVEAPTLEAVDPRGAGDSFTAGVTAALAYGADLLDAVRLGSAAGTLNVARRGLGSGNRREIELLARHVTITEVD